MKVYIIRYEDLCSGEYSSGISYVFDSIEKARTMLEEIKKDEICSSERDDMVDLIHDLMYSEGFIIDYISDYSKYEIVEMEVN
jgi:hypothetical protein